MIRLAIEHGRRLGEPNNAAVPTAAQRTGAVTILDPSSTLATPPPDDLQVPLNPVAQSVLGRYPLPNNPGGQYGANTYTFEFSQPVNDDQWSSSLDHHFTSSDRFFARASYVNHIIKDTDPFAAVLEGSNFSASNIGDARNYAVGETHIFSPTVVNNFTFTLNRGIEGLPETPAEYTTTQTCFGGGLLPNPSTLRTATSLPTSEKCGFSTTGATPATMPGNFRHARFPRHTTFSSRPITPERRI